MSKKNGKNSAVDQAMKRSASGIADRVKAALAPKPPPAGPFAICIAYDPKTGKYGFSMVTANSGLLDVAHLYAALDAGRKHVMGMEQQAALRQAQEQPTVPPPSAVRQTVDGGEGDSTPHPAPRGASGP